MHLSRIPGENAGSATLEGVRATLGLVAGGLDARFVQAGTALAGAYDIVERLVAALEGVTGAMDRETADAAIENMRATADRLAALPQLQQARRGDLDAIQATTGELRDHVARINRTLSFLRICGLNIKVAAAGAEEFSGFADTMFARLDLGEEQLARFQREAGQLAGKVADMAEADALLAAECARVIPQVPAKLAEDALALRQHQADTAAQAARIAEVARAIRGKVAAALGAIQIGDITRQRLEHVGEGLDLLAAFLAERPELQSEAVNAIEGQTLALLAAQAADTMADFRREAGLLTRSLRGIGPEAGRLLALKDGGDGDDGASFLLRLEQGIAEVESVTVQLREADERSDRLGNATSEVAESLTQRLRAVRKVQSDVEQMAWNTGLRCRRMGEDGLALAAIATEIRQFSNNLDAVSGRIAQSFERIAEAAGSIRERRERGGRVDAGRALAESLASIRAGGERMRESLSGLDGDAATVVAMLRESTDKVDCEAEIGGALEQAVADLTGFARSEADLPDATAAPLGELLDRIARRYTMAREREVHRGFAGATGAETEAPAPETVSDDDLFDHALF